MSAYMCSEKHIKTLARFAAFSGLTGRPNVDPRCVHRLSDITAKAHMKSEFDLANFYLAVLWTENARSVGHRYGEKPESYGVPKPMSGPDMAGMVEPLTVLKLCAGLEYQSCECDDYYDTAAYHLLNEIRKAAVRELPGYEDAPWSI